MINIVVSCKQQHITLTKAMHVVHSPINIKVGQGLFLGECCMADCFRIYDSCPSLLDITEGCVPLFDVEHLVCGNQGG